jgi:RNA polymerase sigma-70 factor (ECF subfamily)
MKPNRQAGIDVIFEQLFRDYQQPVLNYLYRLVGDDTRAEELAQDVFVKAYRALPRLPADANRRAWIYRIATNTAYDHLRQRRLIQWLPLLEHDNPSFAHSGSEDQTGEQEAVQQALAQLPPDYRVPLILYCMEGYSIKEIGEIMGISEGAAKTRLCRAREKFRKVYGEES